MQLINSFEFTGLLRIQIVNRSYMNYYELNEFIQELERLDSRKVDAAIKKHAESLLDCYGEMEYV